MSFTDEERAELIALLSRKADMVAGLLDAINVCASRSKPAANQPRGPGAAARAVRAVATATREVAVTTLWIDDRAADEGAMIDAERLSQLKRLEAWLSLAGSFGFVMAMTCVPVGWARAGKFALGIASVGWVTSAVVGLSELYLRRRAARAVSS